AGEIARGGMGAVLRGRDVDLGRDLAIKVLLEKYANRPEIARRFIEEAQIGGQLQHPGVVPVYDIGRFGDRPYFTMKLVKGHTLAHILGERESRSQDRPRHLGIAVKVCETLAYAHAKGVIHRDLKPANIMVGAFGEVQVMDWGLAKVLAEGGIADEERASRAHREPEDGTQIRTARSTGSHGSFGTETEAGSLLGTPAYMPPEQATGDIAHLDRRADVFGLGAILCEILTGKPPYVGRSGEEVRRKAANGDLADATARLDACGADAELIALTKKCLSPEAIDRPKDAQEVTDGLSAYLNGVQERLQSAERERAVAEAKTVEERRRRRVQLALAGSLLAFTTLGGLSATYFLQQRAERARVRVEQAAAVDRVVGQAVTLRDQARENPEDLASWRVALAAVKQAEAAQDELAAARLLALREEIQAGLDDAVRDNALLDALIQIRRSSAIESGSVDRSATEAAYASAFSAAGHDPDKSPPSEIAARFRARPPGVSLAVAVALDDWAAARRVHRDLTGATRLTEAARSLDPDPWRNELRSVLANLATPSPGKARDERLAPLRALASSAKFDELGPVSLFLLGNSLLVSETASAEKVLRQAQRRYPDDVWINNGFGSALLILGRHSEATRYFMAARAIRPDATSFFLYQSLNLAGETEEAVAILRDLVQRPQPDDRAAEELAKILKARGEPEGAAAVLDRAEATRREAVRQKSDDAFARWRLGQILQGRHKFAKAVAEYREAIRSGPQVGLFCDYLARALEADGRPDEAIAVLREGVRQFPGRVGMRYWLGQALEDQKQHEEAAAAYREAVRLSPADHFYRLKLSAALLTLKNYDEVIEIAREMTRFKPEGEHAAIVFNNLGVALVFKGRKVEAVDAFREAVRSDPDTPVFRFNLGKTLQVAGLPDEAIDACREVIRRKPDYPNAHHTLGVALQHQGKLAEAIDAYRETIRLTPDLHDAHYNLGRALGELGDFDGAMVAYREAIRLKPDFAEAHCNLGKTLRSKGDY
ncbi:MAG: tetratricopeptide repeat protein, partial [Alsobacter sp.]